MSKKDKLLFSGPVTTRSGYGAHSRDLLKSLKDMDRFDISIVSMRWGSTPRNALKDDNDYHQWIKDNIIVGQMPNTQQSINFQPEVWVQVTVPNEFQRVGKYNIGVTAGIETTAVAPEWIQGMNKMDLAIVPSEFSKSVFDNTQYEQKNQNGQVVGELTTNTDIEVLFEGYDSDVYGNEGELTPELENELDKIEEDFCFLFVGHWLQGQLGHDRKDVGTLIKTFGDAFKRRDDVALVLKTSHATFSIMDRDKIKNRIEKVKSYVDGDFPVYLIHGDLTDEEMNGLYNHDKMKAFATFTKGEGFGRPMLEFSLTGKPVIATNFSGHLDFLDEKYSVLLDGQVSKVHESAQNDMLIDGSGWFYVDHKKAKKKLKDVFENYNKYKKRSETLGKINREKFTLDKMTEKFEEILDKHLPKFPKEQQFKKPNLPELEKIDESE